MTRAYAIGIAAGTQALILIIPELVTEPPGVTPRAVLMGVAWVINLAVAEYVIHRRSKVTAQKVTAQDRVTMPSAGA